MSQKRKVLVIGMADSIHLARWLKQFVEEDIDFYIFPSKKYRFKNQELRELLHSSRIAKYTFMTPLNINRGLYGFFKI